MTEHINKEDENKQNTKRPEDMDKYETSRWYALLQAIDLIEENCHSVGRSFNTLDLKPIALKHYINSLSLNILEDLESVHEATLKNKTENAEAKITKTLITYSSDHDASQDSSA